MKAIIYARVSSKNDRQNTDRQVKDLTEYASKQGYKISKVFEEHISGAKKNSERSVLNDALDYAKTGGISIILFSELSRLGRNVLNVIEVVKWLADNGINAFFQKENLMLLDKDGKVQPTTTILISCLGMVAEIERENIAYRLNSGRELAIQKGVKMGRSVGYKKPIETKQREYKVAIRCLRKGMTFKDTLARCVMEGEKVSLSTLKRLKKEMI